MQLHCVLTPDSEEFREALTTKLDALDCKYITDIYGSIVVNYEGACDEKLLAILAALEEFGGNRLSVLENWQKIIKRNKRQIQKKG